MLADAGVTVAVSTDASPTFDGQNMFGALRLAATLSRAQNAAARLDAARAEARMMNEAGSLVVQSFCRGACAAYLTPIA